MLSLCENLLHRTSGSGSCRQLGCPSAGSQHPPDWHHRSNNARRSDWRQDRLLQNVNATTSWSPDVWPYEGKQHIIGMHESDRGGVHAPHSPMVLFSVSKNLDGPFIPRSRFMLQLTCRIREVVKGFAAPTDCAAAPLSNAAAAAASSHPLPPCRRRPPLLPPHRSRRLPPARRLLPHRRTTPQH